ncbi:DUF4138 domain-containing protein [uncultured Algibacter sp.]|uniref:DUF4138 domain-containing protein n=1 Tax=uncultured Algibacter sp. TaxID=298659 RepID=UPI002631CFAE|nr:DUF4138 domain-containing protein [uncultured Algibacter sp.]
MKTIILIAIALFANHIVAQQSLDTIYANDKKNVALFFPEPIRQGITGTPNFVFTYNREKEQYFGLLQATPGTESNLLTVTKNGQVYSYILKYKEQLPRLNYFITSKESIGREQPVILKQEPILQPSGRIDYFKKFSNHLLKLNSGSIATKRKRGIKLRLQKMVYNPSEVYLVLEIKNKSEIDFEIDYLNIYTVNGNKKRKASYQKLLIQAEYHHEMPNIIKVGQSQRFVYVMPKFVLGDNEKLMIELQELKGGRKVILKAK